MYINSCSNGCCFRLGRNSLGLVSRFLKWIVINLEIFSSISFILDPKLFTWFFKWSISSFCCRILSCCTFATLSQAVTSLLSFSIISFCFDAMPFLSFSCSLFDKIFNHLRRHVRALIVNISFTAKTLQWIFPQIRCFRAFRVRANQLFWFLLVSWNTLRTIWWNI